MRLTPIAMAVRCMYVGSSCFCWPCVCSPVLKTVFAFEAFLMAGGWLFFDNAQVLYVMPDVRPARSVARTASTAGVSAANA